MVVIEMDNGGIIRIEVDEKAAPITAANFLKLVKEGFYDGLTFHRVISGFMVQGGDPTGTGAGGSKDTIKGEFASNGYNNPLKHTRGVISMQEQWIQTVHLPSFSSCMQMHHIWMDSMPPLARLLKAWVSSIRSPHPEQISVTSR